MVINPKLSIVLATRNEEENLKRCLLSVAGIADEIVIADEQSTDKTTDVAKKFGARAISVPHRENFHITKNVAIDAATGDWVLQLDADEVVSPQLAREIRSVVARPRGGVAPAAHPGGEIGGEINGYWINRKNWFLDRFLTKGGQYPDPTLRLYRKGKGRLPAKDVHEQAVVQGTVGHLRHDLLHYRDTSFSKYLEGFNCYTSFLANQMKVKNEQFNLLNTINHLAIKPSFVFLKIYFRHRGYVDGWAGFVFALFSGLIYPVAYIKFWQRKHYSND